MENLNILKEISESVVDELFRLGNEGKIGEQNSRLIFPIRRDKSIRISEQEARFLFCRELEKRKEKDIFYSIETPTEKKYKFSHNAKNSMSAQTDLTIHKKNGNKYDRVANIEFKAKEASKKAKNIMFIRKDIEKLIKEGSPIKFWFHILKKEKNEDWLFENLERSLKELEKKDNRDFEKEMEEIIFCIYTVGNEKPEFYNYKREKLFV